MDFFSKFKKTDEANPTNSDDQEPADSSSYATETTAATDTTYSSTGDVIKAGADASDEYDQKPAGSYNGDDTTGGGYSDKPSDAVGTYNANDQSGGGYGRDDTEKNLSHGGATTGTDDEYEQQPEGGYGGDKPSSYGGATTETDEYQKPEGGGYGEDTEEESFFKKPTYGGSTAGSDEYEKPDQGEEALSEKASGTETDNYGSKEGYDGDATESYIKKPSGGYGDTTGDYHASADNY